MEDLFKNMGDLFDNFNQSIDDMELAAMWINGKRLVVGDLICINDSGDIDLKGELATHKIIGCFGNLTGSRLRLQLINVIDNLPVFYNVNTKQIEP